MATFVNHPDPMKLLARGRGGRQWGMGRCVCLSAWHNKDILQALLTEHFFAQFAAAADRWLFIR